MAEIIAFVGTYTKNKPREAGPSEGIYAFRFDDATGKLEPAGVTGDIVNPSFLATGPGDRCLYAVSEIADHGGKPTGALTAYAVDKTKASLTLLNREASRGRGSCHVAVDPTGAFAAVANYSGGSAAMFRIEDGGRLSPATDAKQYEGGSVNPDRQKEPHAHSVNFDAAGAFAFVQDLGTDKIWQYRVDAPSGKLVPNDPGALDITPGAGPRHFAFHPNGAFGYLINELNNTVTACAYDSGRGTLRVIQEITTLPEGYSETSYCADIHVHPSGRFLYGSNRGHDSIAIFRIDEADGKLEAAGHAPTGGAWPRNFGIDPAGNFLLAANQDSDNIAHFRIDRQTGALEPTGDVTPVPWPVCVRFVEA